MPSRRSQFTLPPALVAIAMAMLLAAGKLCGQQQIQIQQVQIQLGVPAYQQYQLTAPQLDVVSGATQARLEQSRALVEHQRWDEAVDALRELAADDTNRVVALDEGSYVGLPAYCQLQLSHLPADGLAAYRQRVDATAEQWYRDGLATRDPAQLRRVINEAFCSSWGDDALLAYGELALERGEYATARRAWEAISPLLRDPEGRPEWLALHDVDIGRNWTNINDRWHARTAPPTWLAYPDTNLDLADVRARLILASIREQDFDRAALELEMFRRLHPQAVGRMAGKEGPYLPALEKLLKSAREWPAKGGSGDWLTFARMATRNAVAPALGPLDHTSWTEAVELPQPAPQPQAAGIVVQGGVPMAAPPIRENERMLSQFPIVVNGRVYYCDSRQIFAAELATGKPAVTDSGVLYHFDAPISVGGMQVVQFTGIAAGGPRFTLTAAGSVLYARLGDETTGRLQPARARSDERIVGIDLAREGMLTFEAKPEDGSWSFEGPPVGDGRHVFVALRHSDAGAGAYVACFDAATGRRAWQTSLGSADTTAGGRGDEITHNLLTLAGDRIYVNTNLGFIAALSAEDGRVVWLRRYDRAKGPLGYSGKAHLDRDPSPCVYDRGVLFVAPADSPSVFALEADTGQAIWSTDQLANVVHLLGVAESGLIASGNQLWSVDVRSGRVRFVWPESEHAGARGFGSGLIAGHEIFWPTRDKIYVFDVASGQQTREPIGIDAVSECGANLVAADGRLLIVGQKKMTALGEKAAPAEPKKESDDSEAVAALEPSPHGRGQGEGAVKSRQLTLTPALSLRERESIPTVSNN